MGTDVSAKYRGAFCEAKIKTVKRLVKVKVSPQSGPAPTRWGRELLHSEACWFNSWSVPRPTLPDSLTLTECDVTCTPLCACVSHQVTLKGENTSQVVQDDQVKGLLRVRLQVSCVGRCCGDIP